MSKIEWTDETWNPVTGCTKVSPGCKHCYAERMAKRLQAMGQPKYRNGFQVTLHPGELEKPLHWRKPRMVFVCSMSDLFHESVPDDFIHFVFDVMNIVRRHTYQVLTKRAERMADLLTRPDWPLPPNVWVGVSVENQRAANERIPHLLRVPAVVRFLSMEPLLGPVFLGNGLGLNMYRCFDRGEPHWRRDDWEGPFASGVAGTSGVELDWIIVGGESGPGARPMEPEWVRSIRDQCQAAGVPFFFKQWGGVRKHKTGRILDGKTWDEMPDRRPG